MLGVLKKASRLSDTAPTLVCHLEESSSKLPELFNCAKGSVLISISISSLSCLSTLANDSDNLPIFFPYCDFMRESICCSPRNSQCKGILFTVEADLEVGDLVDVLLSHPGVTGMAYLPMFAGGASLLSFDGKGSSSCSVVADVACKPNFAGSASWSPFSAVVCVLHPLEVGMTLLKLDDIVEGDGS
jgi:hypothetical protein